MQFKLQTQNFTYGKNAPKTSVSSWRKKHHQGTFNIQQQWSERHFVETRQPVTQSLPNRINACISKIYQQNWTKLLVWHHSFVTSTFICSSSFCLNSWRARDDSRSEYRSSTDSTDRDPTTSIPGSFRNLLSSDLERDLVSATLASHSESRSNLTARARSPFVAESSEETAVASSVNCNNAQITVHSTYTAHFRKRHPFYFLNNSVRRQPMLMKKALRGDANIAHWLY